MDLNSRRFSSFASGQIGSNFGLNLTRPPSRHRFALSIPNVSNSQGRVGELQQLQTRPEAPEERFFRNYAVGKRTYGVQDKTEAALSSNLKSLHSPLLAYRNLRQATNRLFQSKRFNK